MRTKKILSLLMLFAFVIPIHANDAEKQQTLRSPDDNYEFVFMQDEGGKLFYHVSFCGETVVEKSQIGIEVDNGTMEKAMGMGRDQDKQWSDGMHITGIERSNHNETWTPLYGENKQIEDCYNQMTISLKRDDGGIRNEDGYDKRLRYAVSVEIRAYNSGIAFRWHFPESGNGLFLNIRSEQTQFTMPKDTKALCADWAQGPYAWRALKGWKCNVERPLFMKLSSGLNVVLAEARMIDYARGKFGLEKDNVIAVRMFDGAEVIPPYSTPWRVIMAGKRAVDIINNKDLILNLNDTNQIEDCSFI